MIRLGSFVLGVASLAAVACTTDQNNAFFIRHNLVPNDDCTVPSSGTKFRSTGQFDLDGNVPYWFTPEIVNAASSSGTTDRNLVYLKGADVELVPAPTTASENLIAGLDPALRARTQLVSGSVEPGGGTTGVAFVIIDTDQAATLAPRVSSPVQIVARVTVLGEINNADTEATPFDFPITLCQNCLEANSCPLFDNQR